MGAGIWSAFEDLSQASLCWEIIYIWNSSVYTVKLLPEAFFQVFCETQIWKDSVFSFSLNNLEVYWLILTKFD